MRSFVSWPRGLIGFLTLVVIASAHPAAASADVPLYTGATRITQQHYTDPKTFPMPPNALSACVVVYFLPVDTQSDAVADFYSKELARTNWRPGPVKVMDGERYLIFYREKEQLVIHLRQRDQALEVDSLAIDFPGTPPARTEMTNFGDQRTTLNVTEADAGKVVHIVCPSGIVQVGTHTGPGIQFNAGIHAAVDYPGLASSVIKGLTLTTKSDTDGVDLGVDAGTAANDHTVRLAYEYNVSVPEGVSVVVEVQQPVEDIFRFPSWKDGHVIVKGAVQDVTVSTNGPVEISNATGKVTVTTTNNPVLLNNLGSDVTVHNQGMWIKAYHLNLAGAVDLETSDGQVEVHADSVDDAGTLTCKTTNSAIRAWLPATASVDLDLVGADCKAPGPLTPVPGTPNRFHSCLNGGKVPIELQTSGGGGVYVQNK